MYRSLPDLFSAVCAGAPQRVAVRCGARRLTYGELATGAQALASELIRRGVARGELVGLRLDRSEDLAIAILGILMAGAAYVPLDPRYPTQRLRYIAQDAAVTWVVGDNVPIRGHRQTSVERLPSLDRTDRAYVIYTSGSTGQPKGCVITHGNVLSLLRAALPLFDVTAADRWSLFHSINFDFSVWEMWGAFATGATLVIADEEQAHDPEAFLGLLIRDKVTVVNQVPPILRSLVEVYTDANHPRLDLRYLILGGDAVDLDTTKLFVRALSSGVRAVNMYGITETTVHVTFKELDQAVWHGANRSPIGRPLPHLGVVLRGPDTRPVPDGEVGEIWVSGTGVGAGYLNRTDLTAERFVSLDGVRHYRSGDLARRLPDGDLQYLGRVDRQVKLRGFRIELEEVEAVLRRCDGVRDAAVQLDTAHPVGERLIAYVVTDDAFDARQVRHECSQSLPSHMVPAAVEIVAAIPLTPSGKLDRAALPRHNADRPRGDVRP